MKVVEIEKQVISLNPKIHSEVGFYLNLNEAIKCSTTS